MNDRNPIDDDFIDRLLGEAFASVRAGDARPSLSDVRRRARRHRRRRTTTMVGSLAAVGAGAVALLATRSPASDSSVAGAPVTNGPSDETTTSMLLATTTTVLCLEPAVTTTTAVSLGTYVIQVGDTPVHVAEAFGVTIEELNAANADTLGYDAFYVGLVINIPPRSIPIGGGCGGLLPPLPYRCLGEGTPGADGFTYFEYCELTTDSPVLPPDSTVYLDPPPTTWTTTTSLELPADIPHTTTSTTSTLFPFDSTTTEP